MTTEKKLRVALIVSVCILIFGGAVMSLTNFLAFLEPLGITLLIVGGVLSFFMLIFWIMEVV